MDSVIGFLCSWLSLFGIWTSCLDVEYLADSDRTVELTTARNYNIPFRVRNSCGYEIGLKFRSQDNDSRIIRNVFKEPSDSEYSFFRTHFPSVVDLEITDSNSKIVFKKENWGGMQKGFVLGGSQIILFAGSARLQKGNYQAILSVKQPNPAFSHLYSALHISIPYNVICESDESFHKRQ